MTKIKANFEYSDFLHFKNQLVKQLLKLTKIHLVVRQYSVSIETTKISCENLLDKLDVYPLPSDNIIQAYLERVAFACAGSKDKAWLTDESSLINEGERLFSQLNITQYANSSDFCCEKHLLGCIIRYFDAKLENKLIKLDPVNMYVRLLSHIDIKVFSIFRERIIGAYDWKH